MQTTTQFGLENVIYMEISEELLKKNAHHSSLLKLDKDIPLPVQLPDGMERVEDFSPSMLTIEMILAGMLTIFAHDRENKNISYYRELFGLIRPNIKGELLSTVAIKINNEDYYVAEFLLHSLIGFDENDLNTQLMLAYLYEKKAKEDEELRLKAKEIYNSLICSEPPFPPVFFNAAVFFMEEEDYKKAKDLLETYIALKIDDEEEEEVQKVEKAQNILNYLNTQIVSDENFKKAYHLIKKEKIEEALPLIYSFIEENQLIWNGWFLLGWALRCQKRWKEGESALKKCLELYTRSNNVSMRGEYSQICNELSICLMEEGKIDEAERMLEVALSKDCENVKLISNLGLIALKKGDSLKAISYFRTVLYIDPNDEIAKAMLNDIE